MKVGTIVKINSVTWITKNIAVNKFGEVLGHNTSDCPCLHNWQYSPSYIINRHAYDVWFPEIRETQVWHEHFLTIIREPT